MTPRALRNAVQLLSPPSSLLVTCSRHGGTGSSSNIIIGAEMVISGTPASPHNNMMQAACFLKTRQTLLPARLPACPPAWPSQLAGTLTAKPISKLNRRLTIGFSDTSTFQIALM